MESGPTSWGRGFWREHSLRRGAAEAARTGLDNQGLAVFRVMDLNHLQMPMSRVVDHLAVAVDDISHEYIVVVESVAYHDDNFVDIPLDPWGC